MDTAKPSASSSPTGVRRRSLSGSTAPTKNPCLPIIAVPTTAGTGTEVDAWTVVTNEATNEKMSGGNKTTFPVLSIVDPDFMLSVPPKFHRLPGV